MFKKIFIGFVVLFGFSLNAYSLSTDDGFVQSRIISKVIGELMADVSENATAYSKDDTKLYLSMERHLAQIVSFRKMSRRVMGAFYKKTSKKERALFVEAFKQNLFNVFIKSFINKKVLQNVKKNYQLIVKKPIAYTNRKKTRGMQPFVILLKDKNKKIRLEASLFLSKKHKKWMIQNLIVEGVNLGINYRSQFRKMHSKYKGDIRKIVSKWTSVSLDKKKKK